MPQNAFLTTQILTYLGNKRSLLPFIGAGVERVKRELGRSKITFFDAFSGSGIVSRFMKRHASLIVANDLEAYSEVVNKCYLTNRSTIDFGEFEGVFRDWVAYAASHPVEGVITRNYAPADDGNIREGERAFYTRRNAVLLDSARAALDAAVPDKYFNLLLAPLLAEASIHANTSGVFKGFYKNRRGVGEFGGEGKNAVSRICGEIRLQKPVLSEFDCDSIVTRGDANKVAETIPAVDLAYFDPPYNQHPYGSNYFMLNLLVANKPPAGASAVSGIPKDWNRSQYNRRREAEDALFSLLRKTPAKYLLVSYNSEGFIAKERFLAFLNSLGETTPLEIEYNTFRGSRNLRNRPIKVTEYLFLVKRALLPAATPPSNKVDGILL
ncbi:MAG: DNA adenine methylase [Kiritimatiellae bacterium]|nr:DNA adenine methylase [Kiritimatiellia bacterium]